MAKENKDMLQKLRCGLEILTLMSYAFLENTYNQMKTVFSGKGTSGEDRIYAVAKVFASLVIGGLLGFAAVFTIVGPVSMLGRMYESYDSGDGNILTGAFKKSFDAGKSNLAGFYKDIHKDIVFQSLGMDQKGIFRDRSWVAQSERGAGQAVSVTMIIAASLKRVAESTQHAAKNMAHKAGEKFNQWFGK